MPKYDRLGIVVTLALLGLILSTVIQLPARSFSFMALGSPLTITLTGSWQMGILLTALVCVGVNSIILSHPELRSRSMLYLLSFWGLPGIVTVVAVILLQESNVPIFQLATLASAIMLLVLIIGAQYRTISSTASLYRSARIALNIVVYLAAFALFVTAYGAKSRSLLSATTILVVSSFLALELLRWRPDKILPTWLYAAITGAIMGQVTWALNYWTVSPLAGAAFLLLIFYFVTGISQQHLWKRLSRKAVLEYAFITALAVFLIVRRLDWLR
jgi:hypothetical protein